MLFLKSKFMQVFAAALLAFAPAVWGVDDVADAAVVAPAPAPARGDLVSATFGGTVDAVGLLEMVRAINGRSPVSLNRIIPLYSVYFYHIDYLTLSPTGSLTTASGLLLVPVKGAGLSSPMLGWQHGTLKLERDAPSYSDGTAAGTSSDGQFGFVTASLGYIVVMPDYLGYGAAKSIFHPYVQASTLASATIDMIRVSRKVLALANFATNGQLFLAGYSEGGYSTLATQREMETNLSTEFTITASAPGSGPYDVSHTAAAVFASTNLYGLTDPADVAFFMKAYDVYYNNPSQLATYFTPGTVLNCVNQDYTSVPTYGTDPTFGSFDGCIGGTTITANILNATFLTSFNTGGEAALKADFALNDIYDWAPKAKTRLFYSPGDDVVPPFNTTNAYNAMVARGSTQVLTVQCLGVSPATHTNCVTPYVIDMLVYFSILASNL